MDKLKLHTSDFTDENIKKIAEMFPNCVTEHRDDKGNIKKSIDFDLLRQELSKNLVEGPQERYTLNWPGKREALLIANVPIAKTLRPCRQVSVKFDATQNLFIEGDNLDALKLLQETYLGKVKMIYIDPPYNTGKNLIYKNDFHESTLQFLERSNQTDEEGNKLVANPESNGRFHSDWLSMIYSRLKVAKNLHAQDGVLVCSIDENELATLCLVLKEIFGESGYEHVCVTVVHNPRGVQGNNFSYMNEFAYFVFQKGLKVINKIKRDVALEEEFKDHGGESLRTDAKNCFYPILVKENKIIGFGDVPEDDFHPEKNVKREDGVCEVYPIDVEGVERKWVFARQSVAEIKEKLFVKQKKEGEIDIFRRKDEKVPRTVWIDKRYDASTFGSKIVNSLVDGAGFTFPKSLWTVYDSIYAVTGSNKEALIMDFFAGSATTAHAVMQLNADDGGNRRFIMVQFPEVCDADSQTYKAGFKTIAEIAKERIRKAGEMIKKENATTVPNLDIGFRVLKIDTSNMQDVYYNPDAYSQNTLFKMADNIKPDRTDEDLLFQVLLDWGVDLSLPVSKEKIAGNDVFFVSKNALAACFANKGEITEDFCKELAKREPLRVVFCDSGFKDDSMKINVEQIFKLMSPHTEVKSI